MRSPRASRAPSHGDTTPRRRRRRFDAGRRACDVARVTAQRCVHCGGDVDLDTGRCRACGVEAPPEFGATNLDRLDTLPQSASSSSLAAAARYAPPVRAPTTTSPGGPPPVQRGGLDLDTRDRKGSSRARAGRILASRDYKPVVHSTPWMRRLIYVALLVAAVLAYLDAR